MKSTTHSPPSSGRATRSLRSASSQSSRRSAEFEGDPEAFANEWHAREFGEFLKSRDIPVTLIDAGTGRKTAKRRAVQLA